MAISQIEHAQAARNARLTRRDLARMVQENIDSGDLSPAEAGRMTIDHLIFLGLSAQVLELIGQDAIMTVWKGTYLQRPVKALNNVASIPKNSDTTTSVPTPLRRQRSVNSRSVLKDDPDTLMESLYKLGSRFVRLGDMTRRDCRLMVTEFKQRSSMAALNARFFQKLVDTMGDNQCVRQLFTNDALTTLYEETL